jgi:gamma-glutamylcyclotransferase (GGCT)/AIG2-like uncharacterized protein YtfP
MYQPEKIVVVYGTLTPGRQNHFVVEHMKGLWRKGIIKGQLKNAGWSTDLGYKAFKPTLTQEQEEIQAVVFFSDELVANWKRLDEFEGNGSKRILRKNELENGETGIEYIYASNEEEL